METMTDKEAMKFAIAHHGKEDAVELTGDDVWALIEEATRECIALNECPDKLDLLTSRNASLDGLIDAYELEEIVADVLGDGFGGIRLAHVVTELVDDRFAELVWEGRVRFSSCADLLETFLRDGSKQALEYLSARAEFDPPTYYSSVGRVFPIELREGQWTTTRETTAEPNECDEPEALVLYPTASHPEKGWMWLAPGCPGGESPTLKLAMAAAEEAVRMKLEAKP